MGLEIIGGLVGIAAAVLGLRWLARKTDRSDRHDNDRWWGDR